MGLGFFFKCSPWNSYSHAVLMSFMEVLLSVVVQSVYLG